MCYKYNSVVSFQLLQESWRKGNFTNILFKHKNTSSCNSVQLFSGKSLLTAQPAQDKYPKKKESCKKIRNTNLLFWSHWQGHILWRSSLCVTNPLRHLQTSDLKLWCNLVNLLLWNQLLYICTCSLTLIPSEHKYG